LTISTPRRFLKILNACKEGPWSSTIYRKNNVDIMSWIFICIYRSLLGHLGPQSQRSCNWVQNLWLVSVYILINKTCPFPSSALSPTLISLLFVQLISLRYQYHASRQPIPATRNTGRGCEHDCHCQAQVQLLDDTDSPGTTNIETTEVAAGNQEEDQQNQAGEDTQQSLAARTQAACQTVAES